MFSENTELNDFLESSEIEDLFFETSDYNFFDEEKLDYETKKLLEDF